MAHRSPPSNLMLTAAASSGASSSGGSKKRKSHVVKSHARKLASGKTVRVKRHRRSKKGS